jgi:hypothetical protein
MKKIYKSRKGKKLSVPQHGYFRRLIRLLFGSLIKRQNDGDSKRIKKIAAKVQGLEESFEIMAREMARRSKRDS